MAQAFIVMQIGNAELEAMCAEAIVPALKACGFDPKRVDKHNQGGLLKSEIISFIERSEIIVADLTNERPNCYLEVGYAMGVDKFSSLILTARDDHNQDNPDHLPNGPKVHFDLRGYDVLFWRPDQLRAFREELEKRIRRRMAITRPAVTKPAAVWDEEWLERNKFKAREGLKNAGLWVREGEPAFTEIHFAVANTPINRPQSELLQAAEEAAIHAFGWPIGVVLHNDLAPKPVKDGILAVIPSAYSYDFWTLRKNGEFYLLQTLFEDKRATKKLFFDTRIVRITEALLYCARLYTRLGVSGADVIHFGVRHAGLMGRVLESSYLASWEHRESIEDDVYTAISFSLSSVDSRIVELTKQLLAPLFELFGFFRGSDEDYARIVNDFVKRCSS
jgi:nucleoside 2-deoxyribosyltransferase